MSAKSKKNVATPVAKNVKKDFVEVLAAAKLEAEIEEQNGAALLLEKYNIDLESIIFTPRHRAEMLLPKIKESAFTLKKRAREAAEISAQFKKIAGETDKALTEARAALHAEQHKMFAALLDSAMKAIKRKEPTGYVTDDNRDQIRNLASTLVAKEHPELLQNIADLQQALDYAKLSEQEAWAEANRLGGIGNQRFGLYNQIALGYGLPALVKKESSNAK